MNNTEIEAEDRRRLHEVILAELAEEGAGRVDLIRVLWHAGVSERDFDATYGGVEDCLFAAYGERTALLDTAVREACRGEGGGAAWPQRVGAGLDALLEMLAASPAIARALLHAFPALGPRARARSQAFHESFGPMLAGGRDASGIATELPGEVEMLATGAVEAIILEEVEAGRAVELPGMLPSLLFSVLVPFLGPGRAAEEMARVRRSA